MASLCLIGLLSLVNCLIIYTLIKPDKDHFFFSSLHKLELAKETPSPRIILTGGSNIAMGVDSKLLEQAFGIPVVNYGLQVRLGVAPMQELKPYIRSGDIILVSLEYYNFLSEDTFFGEPQALADWVEFSPERIQYIRTPQNEAPLIFNIIVQRKINRQLNYYLYGNSLYQVRGIFTSDGFNEDGDFIGHLDQQSLDPNQIEDSMYPMSTLETAYEYLKEYNQYALSKGARVFYEPQANRKTNCEATGLGNMKEFYKRIERNTSIPILTSLDDLCLPDPYFYDTPYHLNAYGREVRTLRLIDNLRKELQFSN